MPNKTPLRDVLRDEHRGGRLRQIDDMTAGRGAHAGAPSTTLSQTGAPMPARQAPRPGPMDNLNKHISKARKVLGLRDGIAIVRGPGGPTGDKIDAKLSSGEAVLPADTVAAVGSDNIQALIDATHTKGKTSVAGGVLRAAGGFSPRRQLRAGAPYMTAPMYEEQIARDADADKLRQARAQSQAAGVGRATVADVAQARGPTRVPPNPAFAQANPVSVDDAIARRAKDYGEQRARPGAQQPLRGKVGVMGRVAPIVAGGMEAMDVGRVAINPDSTGFDVAEQTARGVGRTAAATAGALTGAKIGAAGGAAIGGPFAPVTAPVGGLAGGIIGGVGGYYGADKLMTAGAGQQAPADRLRAGTAASPNSDVPVDMITGSSGRVPESALRQADPNQPFLRRSRDAAGNLVVEGRGDTGGTVTPGTPAAAAQSPLRPNIGEMGSNFAPVSSRASAINKQFDDIAKQIQQLHGGARFQARGTMATKLLELEKARAQALGQDQGAMVDGQGNQVADLNNKRSAETSLYGTDRGFEASSNRDSALRDAAGMRSQADLFRAQQENIRENANATSAEIDATAERLFPESPEKQQAYKDDLYRRQPALASGGISGPEASVYQAGQRPTIAANIKANESGNARPDDFTGVLRDRLPWTNAYHTMGLPKGLDAYAESLRNSILPFYGDDGATYVEQGDPRTSRILRTDGMSIDEQAAVERNTTEAKRKKRDR